MEIIIFFLKKEEEQIYPPNIKPLVYNRVIRQSFTFQVQETVKVGKKSLMLIYLLKTKFSGWRTVGSPNKGRLWGIWLSYWSENIAPIGSGELLTMNIWELLFLNDIRTKKKWS